MELDSQGKKVYGRKNTMTWYFGLDKKTASYKSFIKDSLLLLLASSMYADEQRKCYSFDHLFLHSFITFLPMLPTYWVIKI